MQIQVVFIILSSYIMVCSGLCLLPATSLGMDDFQFVI